MDSAAAILTGKKLVYSKSGGPYAGGGPLRFPLVEVETWGKLIRYGDAIEWTVARLRDGVEVLVVASKQTPELRAEINRII